MVFVKTVENKENIKNNLYSGCMTIIDSFGGELYQGLHRQQQKCTMTILCYKYETRRVDI
jgi:hypothetical protein